MIAVTTDLLRRIALANDTTALMEAYAPLFDAQLGPAGLATPLRAAHFLAQTCVESWSFTRREENLNYSAEAVAARFPLLAGRADELGRNPKALASAAYAGRYGNGNEASGDGWTYRGRGPLQLTFKDNYAHFGAKLGQPFVDDPDMVADPVYGVPVAIAYFIERKCAEAADLDDTEKVTRLINGGTNALQQRIKAKQRALALLGGKEA